jgi:hypothetical protein
MDQSVISITLISLNLYYLHQQRTKALAALHGTFDMLKSLLICYEFVCFIQPTSHYSLFL